MRLGIDLDGCCYGFVPSLAHFIYLDTGRKDFPPHTCYDFYSVDWGYTLDEFLDFCHRGVDAGVVFGFGEPLTDSRETLIRLKEAGHSLHFVTDRRLGSPGRSEEVTLGWLERVGIPYDTLTVSKDKTVVPTDLFVDDKPENVDALRGVGCQAWMLLDQERLPDGRKDQDGHPYMIRTWGDFEQKVKEYCSSDSVVTLSAGKMP